MKTQEQRLICLIGCSAALAFLVTACTTVPVTGRHELNFVSEGQETQLGLSSFDQLKTNTPISRDPAVNEAVGRVAKRISQVAGKDLKNAQWEFVVFENKEANAFWGVANEPGDGNARYWPSRRRLRGLHSLCAISEHVHEPVRPRRPGHG